MGSGISGTGPALAVLPAKVEDLETITRMQFAAFLPVSPIDRLLYPNGLTETVLSLYAKLREDHFSKIDYLKVVEATGGGDTNKEGDILAFISWIAWTEDQPDDIWNKPYSFNPPPGLEPGDMNLAAFDKFGELLDKMKKRSIGGRRCLWISFLATNPETQGRGCGKLLVREAFNVAKQHVLQDIYLVALKSAVPWYKKQFGFETVDSVSLDMSSVGGKTEDETTGWYEADLLRATPS